jgi:hypothetical protein
MADEVKETKHRSPAYPFIPLKRAVERAGELYAKDRRHPAAWTAAATHWGYKPKSSGVLQTISALKQYGLLEDVGGGADRKVKLTDLALAILLDDEVPDSADRAGAKKRAALRPKLYAEMFGKWGVDLPSDETIRTYLKRDKDFNDLAVDGAIKSYKDTLAYAKLTESEKLADADGEIEEFDEITEVRKVSEQQQLQPGRPTVQVFSWPLAKDVTAEVRLTGGTIKPAHLERLRQYLDLAKAAVGTDEDSE